MDMDTVLRLAREAGIERWWDEANARQDTYEVALTHFAELIVAAEREACAEVCEKGAGSHPGCSMWGQGYDSACRAHAAAIRARGAA